MYAASLPFALLIMWFVIGSGPLALLAGDRPLIDRALLAPATGVAIVTLPAFWINRVGYPVQSFATNTDCRSNDRINCYVCGGQTR